VTFIELPDGAKAVVKFFRGDEEWTNSFWWSKSDYVESDLTTLADVVDGSFGLGMRNLISDQATYQWTNVIDMRTDSGLSIYNSDSVGIGADDAEMLPINVAMVMTLRTLLRGRSYRGRVFITGFSEDTWGGSEFGAQLVVDTLAVYSGMVEDAQAAGWTPIVASYQHNGVARVTAVGTTVQYAQVRSRRPGTQRRRLDRG